MDSMWKNTTTGCGLFLFLGCATAEQHVAPSGMEGNARLQVLADGVCLDSETGLTWQATPAPETFGSWEEAEQYVSQFNFGGFADWRLPTYDELYELHDLVERHLLGGCAIKPEISVWSGVRAEDARAGYWYGYATCGGVDYSHARRKQGAVRAVRP